MKVFCRDAKRTVDVQSVEAPANTWREESTVLTENMKGSDDRENGEETKQGVEDDTIGVCGNGYWAGNVDVVIVSCPAAAIPAEGAVDIFLWRDEMENLNEGELLGHVSWEDGIFFCNAEERDEFGDPKQRGGSWESCTRRRRRGNTLRTWKSRRRLMPRCVESREPWGSCMAISFRYGRKLSRVGM